MAPLTFWTEPQVRTAPTKVQLIKETQAVLKLREDNFEELLLPWTLIDEGYYAMAASSPLEKISGRKCLWENLMDQCLEQWTKLTMNAPQGENCTMNPKFKYLILLKGLCSPLL